MADPSLITLRDAPMAEVMKRNEHKLKHKARVLRDLVQNLVRENKQVNISNLILTYLSLVFSPEKGKGY